MHYRYSLTARRLMLEPVRGWSELVSGFSVGLQKGLAVLPGSPGAVVLQSITLGAKSVQVFHFLLTAPYRDPWVSHVITASRHQRHLIT